MNIQKDRDITNQFLEFVDCVGLKVGNIVTMKYFDWYTQDYLIIGTARRGELYKPQGATYYETSMAFKTVSLDRTREKLDEIFFVFSYDLPTGLWTFKSESPYAINGKTFERKDHQ